LLCFLRNPSRRFWFFAIRNSYLFSDSLLYLACVLISWPWHR
jgi:hypothetical protein